MEGTGLHGGIGSSDTRTGDASAARARALEQDAAHWFRRGSHVFGAAFVVYYLLPDAGAWGWFKSLAPPFLLLVAAVVETARIRGWIPTEHMFGLREYERYRVGAYLYFGLAAVLLLAFAPQTLAIPCLVGMALLDPLHGELRAVGRERTGVALGFTLSSVLFLVAGWPWPWAILAGGLMALGEVITVRGVDDDLLMGLLPAVGLGLAAWLGWVDVPAPFLAPLWGVP